MAIENLLNRLDKVKRVGNDKYQSCCPAHEDKNPSLSIKQTDTGVILIHCFGGCGATEILEAIGLEFGALYPENGSEHRSKIRRPWNASDVLSGLAFEILVAWNYAKLLSNGSALSVADTERLSLCASRLQRGVEVAHG